MSLFDALPQLNNPFGDQTAQPAGQGGQGGQQTTQVVTTGGQGAGGNDPNNLTTQINNGIEDQGKQFADLWAPLTEEQKKALPADPSQIQLHNFDPKTFQDAVSKLNFIPEMTDAEKAAIAEGGDKAIAAQMQINNRMMQMAFAQAMQGSMKLVENAVAKTNSTLDGRFNQLARQRDIEDAVATSDPIFKDPILGPAMKNLVSQLQLKFPTASAEDIGKYAKQIFDDRVRKPITEQATKDVKKSTFTINGTDDVDWGDLLSK